MSFRHKLVLMLGATLLAAACSSPAAPSKCAPDIITMGSSFCASR